MKKILISGLIALTAMVSSASATVININSFDNGWYDNTGFHNAINTNIFAGKSFNTVLRNWFAFNLSSISGNVLSANITFLANGFFVSDRGSETFQLNSFEGNINTLVAGGTGLGSIFNDLGDGNIYGIQELSLENSSAMPQFSISLSLDALTDINSVIGGLDQRFALGGLLQSESDLTSTAHIFGGSFLMPAAFLTLEVGEPVVDVPEPGPLALLGFGLLGLAVLRRRKA